MKKQIPSPLDPIDAAWYHMEGPTNPMMVTGLMHLESPISQADLVQIIQTRLLRYPRFQERVELKGLTATPHWVPMDTFHLESQLDFFALKATSTSLKNDLQTLVSKLMSEPLDLRYPLWHITAVEVEAKIQALVVRIHHCIADGLALIGVLLSLTGPSAADSLALPELTSTSAQPALWGQLGKIFKRLQHLPETLESEGLHQTRFLKSLPQKVWASAQSTVHYFTRPPDSETILHHPLSTQKMVAWSPPLKLNKIKAIKNATKTTVNDVLVATLSGALATYLARRGEPLDEIQFRAAVPVNLRTPDQMQKLGNHFGLVFLDLPLAVKGCGQRLYAVKDGMDALKKSPEALVSLGLLKLLGLAPAELQKQIVSLITEKASAVMTNVPGPQETLYFAGAPIDTLMFWAPCSGVLGLSISILSYAGDVRLGLAADKALMPDPQQLIDAFMTELEALETLSLEEKID